MQTGYVVQENFDYVVDSKVKIPMRDGVLLATSIWFPANGGALETHRTWPCVLIRTPYDKSKSNPDMRSPGVYWTQNGYICAIQDVRGRFGSGGVFKKYVNEGEDGYDCVEWIAKQPWSNGSVVTTGISYLAHTQTSMAIYRPPALKAMFVDKGGFWNAFESGIRSGGCFEARQLVWALKKQINSSTSQMSASQDGGEFSSNDQQRRNLRHAGVWFKSWPWSRGASPLTGNYEADFFDMMEKEEYGPYWQQVGLNTELHVDRFADLPAIFLSGWYDIYSSSTVKFYQGLCHRKKGPIRLVMGPWQHTGTNDSTFGHCAGEVDFGMNATVGSVSLSGSSYDLQRDWFDRWVTPASPSLTEQQSQNGPASPSKGPVSFDAPFPEVQYFRMGGADGSKTSTGMMYHGGMWLVDKSWPPTGSRRINCFLAGSSIVIPPHALVARQRQLQVPPASNSSFTLEAFKLAADDNQAEIVVDPLLTAAAKITSSTSSPDPQPSKGSNKRKARVSSSSSVPFVQSPKGVTAAESATTLDSRSSNRKSSKRTFSEMGSEIESSSSEQNDIYASQRHGETTFEYDPKNPLPTLGGNLFSHKPLMLSGAFNQKAHEDLYLCQPDEVKAQIPLAARKDVVFWRSDILPNSVDVSGNPEVVLYVSSSCVDTDFYVKLIDEYPPSHDYPSGFHMNITHGIVRARWRNGRGQPAALLKPGEVVPVTIQMYPTSNLFKKGHRIAIHVSSSCFPHWDINMNTGITNSKHSFVAHNTVHHSAKYPSALRLPVVCAKTPLSSLAKRNHRKSRGM
mmetsp:Transcript_23835/g.46978  ORF Transcript_23835/g.46978 Transcript_23835/m.46978 type:complete len:793 (+) Transcript_23835:22-2400(+)